MDEPPIKVTGVRLGPNFVHFCKHSVPGGVELRRRLLCPAVRAQSVESSSLAVCGSDVDPVDAE